MAANILNTRIRLKYDTLSNWNSSSFTPLAGEMCIAIIPNATTGDTTVGNPDSSGLSPYAIGVKVGDGTHTFAQLPWIQAIAGDVYAWAKASTKPSYTADEINGLSNYISGQINDTDTVYRILTGTDTNDGKYFLQAKAKGANDSTFTTVSTIDLTVLSDTLTGTPGAGKTITAFDEVNGKVTATFSDISITKNQISDAGTAIGATVATSAIVDNDSSNNLTTKAQVASYVASKTSGLSGAMHYKGSVSAIPPASGTYDSGDVVLLTSSNKEYIYDGTNWKEFGDEGSYALKTITISAGSGLSGGGTLESNRTISHATPTGAGTSNNVTATTGQFVNSITFDSFGHVTGVSTGSASSYTFAEGTVNGAFSVTPADGSAQSVSIHGLGAAAYKDLSADGVVNGNTGLVTADQVYDHVASIKSNLSGSATATAASGNQYSVLTGVTESNGIISKSSEVTLAAIAKTGSIYDVIEHNTVTENSASVNYLVFDCGDASHLITDA